MKSIALSLLLGLALPAFADRLPLPADTPASYKTECASCHIAYSPALLSAADWQRTVAGLKNHFGSDAALDDKAKQEIAAYLKRHAGDAGRLGNAGEPPRLTQTTRFVRKHHEVPHAIWRDPRVKSAANCEACHRGAAQGNFSEHEVSMPGSRR